MKKTTAKSKTKVDPIPIRFEADEDAQIRAFSKATKIPVSQLARMAVRYTLPKLISGEIGLNEIAKAA